MAQQWDEKDEWMQDFPIDPTSRSLCHSAHYLECRRRDYILELLKRQLLRVVPVEIRYTRKIFLETHTPTVIPVFYAVLVIPIGL